MKIAVTGSQGLLGWHTCARIHAEICAAKFRYEDAPFQLNQINRATFADPELLSKAVMDVDAIIHFAGVNRGEDKFVEAANPKIADTLIAACKVAKNQPHIIYANSTHSTSDSYYGRSKRIAGEKLSQFTDRYTNLVLPHIFGECAKPNYNNVTATLIDGIWNNREPKINPNGQVELLHAGEAAQIAINSVIEKNVGKLTPVGHKISVQNLFEKLSGFHESYYNNNIFPDFSDSFNLNLFNSYRTAGYPRHYPMLMKINEDSRGILFESSKGGNSPQSFISTTHPGIVRGNHFHLDLVERFLVVKGDAIIRVRRVLTNEVHEFHVSGVEPAAIDMPPLHTHHIENVGAEELVTFFWSHRIFDSGKPDTYANQVLKGAQ